MYITQEKKTNFGKSRGKLFFLYHLVLGVLCIFAKFQEVKLAVLTFLNKQVVDTELKNKAAVQ